MLQNRQLSLALLITLILQGESLAAPQGGVVVGGSGSIQQQSNVTSIQQSSQSLAINWNSFDVSKNETVNFVQPNSSAIALNRILGGSVSQIFGQINANGQVVLVNPAGIFFGQNATVNVGGLIASGLDIAPADFMNSEYLFNAVDGSGGVVVNSGTINASLGGSVGLLGKSVTNDGLISASLGSVILATGKQAVLSFDAQGLLGIQVSEAVIQDELGIDPALVNSGEITANGGRVLLTGSQSRDVFSSAVNSVGIEQAASVVVHDDGSFTSGNGGSVGSGGSYNFS